ncbi:SIS domain-containing protein [Mesorhizobium sp.]|uniref:SIS domain-containing protein n=1 Tax=Mesorhizobium sp. TaxID=1871066 RepID=UPI0011F5C3F9|nr:SIS domain-containing protein [Mesorhizobium sp.]TIS98037.1 MAG: SIS domain-containing protein [Mesorhizobium sp.]
MNATEKSIFEQFPYWDALGDAIVAPEPGKTYIVLGCGSSYNLALSTAVLLNERGTPAIAVPGNEWFRRPQSYCADPSNAVVIAISRSGESSELVRAVQASRSMGLEAIGITCSDRSSLARHSNHLIASPTHPSEGIVMTASASLMLLMALKFAGYKVGNEATIAARDMLENLAGSDLSALSSRSHFVFLGGGALYGLAAEGGLKLQEMACTFTQAYHPLEYRHGPVSLVDERSAIIILYQPDTREEEEQLADELRAKGGFVIGFGGKGHLSLAVKAAKEALGLVYLPALQLLGERVAQMQGQDTSAPRHLAKVVVLA